MIMPNKLVLRDCVITVNGVVFSDHVSSVTVNLSKDEIDTTNFSGSGRERQAGLKDDSFEINFQQNFSASEVHATLFPLYDDEEEFEVRVRPTAAAISVDNPEFRGTCVLLEYQPLAGDVGALSETSVTFPTQRTGITQVTAA